MLHYVADGRHRRVTPTSRKIQAGPSHICSGILELSPRWSEFTDPEGQCYFVRDMGCGPRIVTDAYIHRPEIMEDIAYWSSHIEDQLVSKNMVVSDATELFLTLDGVDCMYYFVDHNTRTEFWMDQYETDDLNLVPVMSDSHLSESHIL